MEEYILWGSRGDGKVATAWINVTVQEPPTTAPEVEESNSESPEAVADIPENLSISDAAEHGDLTVEIVSKTTNTTSSLRSDQHTVTWISVFIAGLGLLLIAIGVSILFFIR